jgi:hypothetical protein
MVKNVVKSEYRMIDMWSCFQTVEALENCSAGRKKAEKKHSNLHMWSTPQKEMINMWSEQSGSYEQGTASSSFCRCCIVT